MGVTGLWKLIEPCGQPVPVEVLENKILAIDISIWLHQVVKGFQDNKGSALANAHLLGLFHRLCKLMYYRIKPVFVFDGKVPSLKKETIAKRNKKRNKLAVEAERIQALLLQSLAKEKVVQQALGPKAIEKLLKSSPVKNRNNQKNNDVDMYELPDMPQDEEQDAVESEDDIFEPKKIDAISEQNLQAIDVKSKHFLNLPADIRHEILIDIKETRKLSSWGKIHELPSKSNDFSSYQMKRLLKRRQVQESIDDVVKEMDGVRTFTLKELENIFSEEGIIETPDCHTKQLCSDSNTRYLLIKNLKETLATAAMEESKVKKEEESEDSKITDGISNDDLEKAIQMSLDDAAPYNESDYYSSKEYKLNSKQRSQLKNAGLGIARNFMIEYGGMNDEDVKSLLENTQLSDDESFQVKELVEGDTDTLTNDAKYSQCNTVSSSENKINTKEVLEEDRPTTSAGFQSAKIPSTISIISNLNSSDSEIEEVHEDKPTSTNHELRKEHSQIGIISDSSDDSEFEEVKETEPTSKNLQLPKERTGVEIILDSSNDSKFQIPKATITKSALPNTDSKQMEIFVDLSKTPSQEDDIFADCFKTAEEKSIEKKPTSLKVSDILQDLKKQAAEATKINLSDIKIDSKLVEISDDESDCLSQRLIYETDSDTSNNLSQNILNEESEKSISNKQPDNIQKEPKSLPLPIIPECKEIIQIVDSDSSQKSSTNVTPSKTRDISDYFETKFIVKRTPEKDEQKEDIPKVTSPFFVRKSPKSSNEKTPRKRGSAHHDGSPLEKKHKVNKMLFEKNIDDDSTTSKSEEMVNNEQAAIEYAAMALKEKVSTDELEDIASKLAKEKHDLEKERNRQDRMGMTITEKMNSECMELLRLFGVPFIVAPMEAEAQCAFLDAIELTNGTITDDSDIWLFGGRTVYKNFFAQNKHVMEFKYDTIKRSFNVDRNKLVQLALLVGSDYTTGINGIGTVTALEILATFSPKDISPSQQTSTVLTALINFRDWWVNSNPNKVIGSTLKHRLRNKLENIELHGEFPSSLVVEAYLQPTVDNSQSRFSWGTPDHELIMEFARTNFGWTRSKTDEILAPVLKKLNEKKSQATIKNYFTIKSFSSTKELAVSKRVRNAINIMSSDFKSDEETEQIKPTTQRRKRSSATSTSTNSMNEIVKKKRNPRKNKNAEMPNIPISTDVIPQRVKDQEEMEEKKKLAAIKFKQSRKNNKTNK